jgi:predicted peptidase
VTLAALSQASDQIPESLLVFLHGRGEIGGDTDRQVRIYGPWANVLYNPKDAYGPDTLAELRRYHALGFHLSAGDWDGEALSNAVDRHLAAHPTIDPSRLFLTGISLGGRGVLRLALHRLRTGRPVSAIASFCPAGGSSSYSDAEIGLLRTVPTYLFHCPEDMVVPFEGSAILHQRLGSDVSRLRIVHRSELANEAAPHDCWTQFYGSPGLYRWLSAPGPDPAGWPHLDLPHGRAVQV